MHALVLSAILAVQLQETITVSRVLVDVRVTEWGGEPIADLTAADFDVRIDGRRASVESVEWIDEGSGVAESPSRRVAEEKPAAEPRGDSETRRLGRLVVIFVQTDFTRQSLRIEGQMKFLMYADEMLATLGPEDRVAVFSFDSQDH